MPRTVSPIRGEGGGKAHGGVAASDRVGNRERRVGEGDVDRAIADRTGDHAREAGYLG